MYSVKNLDWANQLERFNDDQKRVLLALSHDQYKWRTREAIGKVTGLDEHKVDATLSDLLRKGLIRPSFSRDKNLIFGLKERVS